jgi:hypothetical protein
MGETCSHKAISAHATARKLVSAVPQRRSAFSDWAASSLFLNGITGRERLLVVGMLNGPQGSSHSLSGNVPVLCLGKDPKDGRKLTKKSTLMYIS